MVNGTIDIYTYVRTRVFQSVHTTMLIAVTTQGAAGTDESVSPEVWAVELTAPQQKAA